MRDRRPKASKPVITMRSMISVQHGDGLTQVDLQKCFESHLGLRIRRRAALHALRKTFVKGFGVNFQKSTITVTSAEARAAIDELIVKIEETLEPFAWRPLTPRLTAEILNISKQERNRWTKDGRLPSVGRVMEQRRQAISVPVCDVRVIERLVAMPEIIRKWREQDIGTKPTQLG